MIIDFETLPADAFASKEFDVCIMGAGPAGITLARKLAGKGFSVGLFEGGGLEQSPESQDLYKGPIGAQPYFPLDGARLRFLGGSSNHWGGWTRPLDSYDFEVRGDHPDSGWPIGKADLDPYAAEADGILDLPEHFTPPDMFEGAADTLKPGYFRFSNPTTRFGQKYRAELDASDRISTFVNANLVDIRLEDSRRTVSEAVFRGLKRPGLVPVKAKFFALCLGGIENPRALLNASSQVSAGIGNENDIVGRYFLEHPHLPVGNIVVRKPITFMLVYSPTPEFMKERGILSFGLRLGNFEIAPEGVFTGPFKPQPECSQPFEALLAAAMKGEKPACPAHVGGAFLAAEQGLNPDSRVRLANQRDRFGLRQAELDWNLSEIDFRTIRAAVTEAGRLMAAHDVGRMHVVDWLLTDNEKPTLDQLWGGSHHMGTTRMSDDPKKGVVDRNQRIHSLDNLYVGGSSVFATCGHSNPTYSIVQLTLRLSDHLATRLG
ncbi:MAG: GMC family oxidoreductase [Rhizobiales bacterium]|nr:GMC family oxidoreductase [Hyphomicrobiales bacterium]MBN9009114.1 GMC family oxidoreductase [Hyphomicrobiales bacterium]